MSRYQNVALAWTGFSIAMAAMACATPALAQAVPASVGTPAPAGTYDLQVDNGTFWVDALVTTDSNGHAALVSGLVNGTDSITGLSSYAGADNNLYASGAWVTFAGLSFSTASLGDFNFYNSGLGYYGLLSSNADINGFPDGQLATAEVAPVPEPATWAMMLLGFGAAGLRMRRARRAAQSMPQAA